MRWSSSPKVVLSSYLPESRPLASGTRAMMPTPASTAAGSTRSSGLRRKTLRMICTLATFGRAIARSASSTVSTETPYAARLPCSTSAVEGVEDPVVVVDGRGRAVQLHEVERVDAEVLAAAVGPGAQGVGGERLGHVRVGAAAALGHDGQAGVGPLAQQPADEPLAAAVAVDVGRVEHRHAGVDRGVQHRHGVVLAHRAPVGTELPAAQADHRDRTTGPAECSHLHVGGR